MKSPKKNWLEWSCFAVGLLLLASVIGYLAYDAVTLGGAPPRIEFKLGEPRPQGDRFGIAVVAENHGDQTAEAVHVEVVLKGGKEERAQFVIEHLPRHGRREGFVTFETDPRTAQSVEARALGFQLP